ncbi:MAG: prenyltransferase [Kofleriaceae bacterium]|nr:prenyltransferase [Kofleriaceae bacterium]
MSRLVSVIKLGRPLFLGGGFILYGLGAAIAAATGHTISAGRYALGQGAVTAFQLMTHYANDYFDYDADRANATPTKWSGGSRVLPDGELPRSVALICALVCAAIGIAVSGVIATSVGSLALPMLAIIGVLAWFYSAPPLRLCATGLGELDTAVVVTVLVPWLGFYLQAGTDDAGLRMLALSVVPPALLQLAMLLAIEFPDAAGDAATGKRTLVVRLGARTAARLYVAITAGAFVWPAIAYACGLPARVALAMLVPTPIAVWRMLRVRDHADASAFERLTFWAVGLLVITSALELAAWLPFTR